jgi:hypothetical protein
MAIDLFCVIRCISLMISGLGHIINVLLMSSEDLSNLVSALGGIGKFLEKVRLVFSGFVLDTKNICIIVAQPFRLRFNLLSIYQWDASSA